MLGKKFPLYGKVIDNIRHSIGKYAREKTVC